MGSTNDPKFRHIADVNFMQAYHWLGENKQQFKSVVEPACFSMNVVDPKYSYAIEGCITIAQMKTFIFEHEEDYQKFNKYFDSNPFGTTPPYRPNSWYRPQESRANPLPQSDRTGEEIKAAGFDGFAVDLVRAPPLVMWYLVRQLDFHRIVCTLSSPFFRNAPLKCVQAVCINPRGVDQERAARMFAPSNPGTTVRYIIGYTLYAISRSTYGRRLVSNTTSNINKTDWYNAQPGQRRSFLSRIPPWRKKY